MSTSPVAGRTASPKLIPRDETKVDSPSALRLLRLPRVKDRVGLGRSSIYSLVASGHFPRPISLGGRAMAWLESDINAWIQTKVDAARARQ